MLNNLSISSKLKLLLLLSASILIILFSSVYIYFGHQALKESLIHEANQLAELSAERLATSIDLKLYTAVETKLEQITQNKDYEAICVYDREAKIITALSGHKKGPLGCPEIHSSNTGFSLISSQPSFFISSIKNIWANNVLIGAIFVARSDVIITTYLNEQISILAIATAITLVFYFFIAAFLQSIISKPIIEISNSAKNLIELGGKGSPSNNDELQVIKSAVRYLSQHINSQLEKFSNDKREKDMAFMNVQGGLDKLIGEYKEAMTAIATYHDIQKHRSLGSDIDRYSKYHMDVYGSMLNYNTKLESFKHISDVYYQSILEQKEEIQLIPYVKSYLSELKKRLPFLKIDFEPQRHGNLTIQVYKKAWDESFAILTKLFDTITAIVPFDAKLSIVLDGEEGSLFAFFYDANSYSSHHECREITKHAFCKEREEVNSKCNSRWLLPQHADVFLEENLLEFDQLKYILDMMSYIHTANRIEAFGVLESNLLGIHLGFVDEKMCSREDASLVIE